MNWHQRDERPCLTYLHVISLVGVFRAILLVSPASPPWQWACAPVGGEGRLAVLPQPHLREPEQIDDDETELKR